MTQSRYTLELRTLLVDQNFKLFDFDYSFYSEEIKPHFENLFINEYYYNEIGQETVTRFKQRLKHKLNLIAPYYKQLYDTEIASKGITFLLNKDLEETFIRDVLNDSNNNTTSDKNINNTNSNNTDTINNSTNNTDFKESNLDNGTANALLIQDSLTTVNNTVDNVNSENNVISNGNSTIKEIDEIINISNNNTKEETKLISKGNIGTTSSAQLLKEWRAVLININELIIEECRELFMGVF